MENQQNNYQELPPELVDRMVKDRKVRIAIVSKSHFYFFHFYFSHYIEYPTANFQKEFFRLTEDDAAKKVFVVAFRGSAKSSIFTTSYPVWAILGNQEKKFVLILCQTRNQAKQHMMNLKRELEGNTLLRNDLGPFQEENDEWGSVSLVFSRQNARITAASSEQSIRGLRHNQHRPDLIIADDIEDIASVKTRESRQKTYEWFTGEVIPAGGRDTKIISIGNLLHEDSLLMKLRQDIEENVIDGIFRFYPLIEDEKITWPGKYLNEKDIETERRKVGNEVAWQREYLLKIIPSDDQVIHREWIHYYNEDELPPMNKKHDYRFTWAGVDLAISDKATADFTAIVSARVYGSRRKRKIYILPYIINKRLTFPQTIEACIEYIKTLDQGKMLVEDVGYQRALPQLLRQYGKYAEPVQIKGDKKSRLAFTGPHIQNGTILFPRKGAEILIQQIVGFGVEKYDDIMDAFTLLINELTKEDSGPHGNFTWWDDDGKMHSLFKHDDEWEKDEEESKESTEDDNRGRNWKFAFKNVNNFDDDDYDFEIDRNTLLGR